MLAIKLFNYYYFFERDFLFEKVFLIVHQIYPFIRTHTWLGWKLHETKRHFHKMLILNSWKLKSVSFECCKFYYLKRKKYLALSRARIEDLTQQIWKVSCRGLSKKICIQKFTVVLLQSSLTKIWHHVSFWLKRLFNLSTMLSLKSLWKYHMRTSKPEHIDINRGSMIL